jgi:hypothetical protein
MHSFGNVLMVLEHIFKAFFQEHLAVQTKRKEKRT